MKVITIAFLLSFPLFVVAQTGISGTVTYPVRPDAGSNVYVIKYEGDAVALYDAINNFLTVKNYRSLNSDVDRLTTIYKDSASVFKGRRKYENEYNALQAKIAKVKSDADERSVMLKTMGGDTKAGFDNLDEQASKALSKAKYFPDNVKATTDAAGNYSLNTGAGKYAVMIVSNNRTGFTSTESSGKVFLKLVDVKENGITNVSARFTVE